MVFMFFEVGILFLKILLHSVKHYEAQNILSMDRISLGYDLEDVADELLVYFKVGVFRALHILWWRVKILLQGLL